MIMAETYTLLAKLSRKCHYLHLFMTGGHSKMAVLSNCLPRLGLETQPTGYEFTYANSG